MKESGFQLFDVVNPIIKSFLLLVDEKILNNI